MFRISKRFIGSAYSTIGGAKAHQYVFEEFSSLHSRRCAHVRNDHHPHSYDLGAKCQADSNLVEADQHTVGDELIEVLDDGGNDFLVPNDGSQFHVVIHRRRRPVCTCQQERFIIHN